MSIKQREASLRARATPSEIQLKSMLDLDPRTAGKFKFQAHCCGYYVDFLFSKQKLVVELDGACHGTPAAKIADAKRTRKLTLKGYRVIRFWNGELRQPTAVLCRILNALQPGALEIERKTMIVFADVPMPTLDDIGVINTRPRRRAGATA